MLGGDSYTYMCEMHSLLLCRGKGSCKSHSDRSHYSGTNTAHRSPRLCVLCVCCVLSVFVGVHVSGCANVCVESGRRSTECRHIAVRRHSRPSNVTLYLVHSRVHHSHGGIHSTRSCHTTPVGTLLHFDTSGYLYTCEHTGIHKQ